MMEGIESRRLLGIDISVIDMPQLLEAIDHLAVAGRPALVNNVNIHACNLAFDRAAFRSVLNRSDIVFCDGYGVKLAGLLKGFRLGQRMTPPDWIDDLFALCVQRNYRVYFIGDEERVVKLFVDEVMGRHPNLLIAGYHDGFFDVNGSENDRIVAKIKEADADIVITAMGMPRQELWAANAINKLDKGVFIATGALFRWYTGVERRAPKWITASGLEWLARLIVSPVRHFKRYVIGIPRFYWRILFCSGKALQQ